MTKTPPTSPMNTATAAGAAAVLAPVVSWIAGLCHVDLPPEVLMSIVVLLVSGAHWASNLIDARKPETPTQGATQ